MSNKMNTDEDSARFARVLQQLSEITVDEWEAKIAFYAAETERLELLERELLASEPVSTSSRKAAHVASTSNTSIRSTAHRRKTKVAG